MSYEDREVLRVSVQLCDLLVNLLGDKGNDVMGLLEEYVTVRIYQREHENKVREQEREMY